MLILDFLPEASISVSSWRLFCIPTCPLGACFLSVVQRQEVVCLSEIEMYYFYGKINWGYIVCLLCGGGPYLGESIIGGSTVDTIVLPPVTYHCFMYILTAPTIRSLPFFK